MSKPRIGITCSPLRGPAYYVAYHRAIEAAGGEPVALESQADGGDSATVRSAIGRVDGLLLPGGWDVDPPAYGETREQNTRDVDPDLDRMEIALIRAAVAAGMPVFGICRGQQVINVALGGSLRQHVDGHDMHGHARNLLAHPIAVDADSELARVATTTNMMVNSLHHQSVKDVAPSLRVTAHSPDGIVEALESRDGDVLAVQCHPEELWEQQGWAMSVFQRFVERVGANMGRDPSSATRI